MFILDLWPKHGLEEAMNSVDVAQSLIDDSVKNAVKINTAHAVDTLILKRHARHDVVSKEGLMLLHEAAQHRSPRQALEICQLPTGL